jgi:hypothetical protein
MRYHLDSMLPEKAFQPRTNGPFARGMTLEGGGPVALGGPIPSTGGGGGGGGGGGKGGGFNPITTIVTVVAAVAAPEILPAILPEVTGTEAAMIGAGVTRAATTAINGGNVEQVLVSGAESAAAAGVGAEVSSAVGGQVGYDLPADQAGPVQAASGVAGETGSQVAGNIAGRTVGGAASGFTGAQLAGQNLENSLKSAEIGGATGFATSALGEGLKGAGVPSDTTKDITTVASPFVGQNIANLFTPQTSSQTVGRPGQSSVTTTGQAGTTPGSQALAQALQVGSPDVGAPVQSPGGGESSKQPVWNVASLRTMDQTGSPDSGSSA